MQEINYLDALRTTHEHLAHGGVFLNIAGETPNTMTIGWASIGYLWNRPVMTVLVRPQRHSYAMLKKAGEFTVSVPTRNSLRQELAFAGTQSGRDVNKFEGHGLTALPAQQVGAPIVGECGLHFECRVLLTQDMTGDQLDDDVARQSYPQRDYHTLFFGEILRCYTTDENEFSNTES